MSWIGFDELEADAPAFDIVVERGELPDRFCASSAWILSAREAFTAEAPPWILRADAGWAPLMEMTTSLGRTLMPLEAGWGLAAPMIGFDQPALAHALVNALRVERARWDALFLSGIVRGGPEFTTLVHLLSRRHRLGLGQSTVRAVASLAGGLDGWLSRRTAHFRKNLRQDQRRAAGNITFTLHAPTDAADGLALYARILEVEARSWKGLSGHGIQEGPMRDFYARMIPRLTARGRLRVTFAQDATGDVGYVLGGVFGGEYRGLQVSFDQTHKAIGLGNLLQLSTITGLCNERILAYDLGTEMPYKAMWAERRVETVALVVR